jgi:hypothetical protein
LVDSFEFKLSNEFPKGAKQELEKCKS